MSLTCNMHEASGLLVECQKPESSFHDGNKAQQAVHLGKLARAISFYEPFESEILALSDDNH